MLTADRKRIWIALLVVGVLAAVTLLAAGLSTVDLAPGEPFQPAFRGMEFQLRPLRPAASPSGKLLGLILSILIALAPFSVIFAIIHPDTRRQFLRNMLIMAIFVGIIYLYTSREDPPAEIEEPDVEPVPSEGAVVSGEFAPPEFVADPPPWVAITVSGVVLLFVAAIGYRVWQNAQDEETPVLDDLADSARQAADAIRRGESLQDTVMRCYIQMSHILSEERGIDREAAMTPREFERRLRATGLPLAPIQRLTRLFETVRYGAHTPGPDEEQEALTSLSDIAEACGRAL